MTTYRIVSDSSSNIYEIPGSIKYLTTPLKILVDGEEYIDQAGLDLEKMVNHIETSKVNSTSCPNAQEWLDAFEGADVIFAITISSALSGSYASAQMAAEEYMKKHEGVKIYVVDSLSTGGEMVMIIEKLRDLMEQGLSFEEIREQVQDYQRHTHLIFYLESLSNLAKNGRLSPAVAKIAGLLGIRFVGRASDKGTIHQAAIAKGAKKAISAGVAEMVKMGYRGGRVAISHTLNTEGAERMKSLILEQFPQAVVTINPNGGLCSYYAERGGMIIGFDDYAQASV
ncbi:MAG: DegV family protein [Solobacterium sp.]|nr:DegV family protein [Solobacterium sp.]